MPTWDDTDYALVANTYAACRLADPVIAQQLYDALGDTKTVINVGAGAGSYEPRDRYVIAVEPSIEMRSARPSTLPPAVDAQADSLPFDDHAFEGALAVLTVHHWPEPLAGLRELRRVTQGVVVVMTADPAALDRFWLEGYAPEFLAAERRRYPSLTSMANALGGDVVAKGLRIPLMCTDGFSEAFYGRPEAFLRDDVRRAQSAWSFVEGHAQERFLETLTADLASGVWDHHHGRLRRQSVYKGSMRLLIATPRR